MSQCLIGSAEQEAGNSSRPPLPPVGRDKEGPRAPCHLIDGTVRLLRAVWRITLADPAGNGRNPRAITRPIGEAPEGSRPHGERGIRLKLKTPRSRFGSRGVLFCASGLFASGAGSASFDACTLASSVAPVAG